MSGWNHSFVELTTNNNMKTLYKKDSKNKIRVLNIWTDTGILYQSSGILNGKLVTHHKACNGKNVGKSNATDPISQSRLEAAAIIKDKLTEGYFETIEECEKETVILPMLAKSYEDEEHKIDWNNCFIQPKLDGMRCLAHITANGGVELISRDGKVIGNMEHIINDLSTIKEDVILDGELYAHGLSFQENMKLIKKLRPETSKLIKYHVYDLVSNEPFRLRKVRGFIKSLFSCEEVSTYDIKNKQSLMEWHEGNIYQGYEGSIIRWGNEGYKTNGRSSNLLKYKDFQDIDAEIIDVIPNEANPLHGTPILKYRCQKLSGVQTTVFKAGVKMSHSDREELLSNREIYIGKIANIRFFEWTDDGNPRFPVMVGIHGDR